jgi:putative N-acetylmannosamine-6-phosphate epimerase
MNKLNHILKKPFVLLVSLPVNTPEMAMAAQEGGADGIKVHINVEHFASGTRFGSWDEEKDNIRRIIESVSIPVGLLPAADKCATRDEILDAQSVGVSFLDAFAHHMPVNLCRISGMGYMLAVNQSYTPDQITGIDLAGIDAIEATLLTHEDYGRDLTARDLSLYYNLAKYTMKPVLIPTQKKIRPEETLDLHRAGARGLIIGAVATGRTAEGVKTTTKTFRDAIGKIF